MICKHCGFIVPDGALVCPQCGAETDASRRSAPGAAGIRQGRRETPSGERAYSSMPFDNEPPAQDAVVVSRRRPRSQEMEEGQPPAAPGRKKRSARKKRVRRFAVNWALVWVFLMILLFLAAAGAYAFLKITDQGQLILARLGRDANATALWTYGQELYDQGYLDRSIQAFEKAYAQEPDREDIYDRLRQLADVYENSGRAAEAEEIYIRLYTEVDEKNPLAYRDRERMLQEQGRLVELSSFLQTAYEKTGDVYFRRQREALLPAAPTADEGAGTRREELDVRLQSANDYEIYYLFGDEGILPDDGMKYQGPIHLGEGTHVIRAVAVSSDLQSDELRIQYIINLLKPTAPTTTLQPGEYKKRYKIGLTYVPGEDEEKSQDPKIHDITIYYTLDGQTPTSNSPIYTGEKFMLPAGKSWVKAVAVNGYGKVSNVMEKSFKVNVGFEKFFNNTDEFSDFTIMKTSLDEFVKRYGAANQEEAVADSAMPGSCLSLAYGWGEARFWMSEKGYVLYSIQTTQASMVGPRKTKIGMSETDVTEKFRDMGQTNDQNGDRSLYFDSKEGVMGKVYHLDTRHDRIDYVYTRPDQTRVTLSYALENSRVVSISMKCGN